MSQAATALHQRGKAALDAGQIHQAIDLLHQAASHTTVREADYQAVLRDLQEAFARASLWRAMLSVAWYTGDVQRQRGALPNVPLADRGRTLQAWAASTDPQSAQGAYRDAAAVFEEAGLAAQAAICHEKAGARADALRLWTHLANRLTTGGRYLYAAGLARFNVSRMHAALDRADEAHAAVVGAVHMLEVAADRFEQIGQRERTFDCYQVMIAIGRQSRQFEHVLEGYVNVLRILREDDLRYYALQSYEDAIAEAEKEQEFSAGATLALEMAGYATSQKMTAVANHASQLQGRLWQSAARATLQRKGPSEMAENAMLAAIVAFARQRQFAQVGLLYQQLSELDIEAPRKVHYARAARRYQGVTDAAVSASPLASHLRQDAGFPDVWHVDMVEWEQQGSASAAMADIVLDRDAWPETTRRRALLARLAALDIDVAAGTPAPAQLINLAQKLTGVQLYAALSPLEQLFESRSPEVRAAVVEALEKFMYKRSFVTVRAALDDADAQVRHRATTTVAQLNFRHAFDPLARIFRDAIDPAARSAALTAIAKIDSHQAAEMMLRVLDQEGPDEREVAVTALRSGRGQVFLNVARESLGELGPNAQAAVRTILQARGG